jgi:hypothetical protein
VAVVEGGDPGDAEALGEGDHGGVGAAQPQAGVGGDQFGDALPVLAVEAGDRQLAPGSVALTSVNMS